MSVAEATTIVGEVLEPYEAVRRYINPQETLRNAWATYWGTLYGTSEFWFAYAQYQGKLEYLRQSLRRYSKDQRTSQLFDGAMQRLIGHYDAAYLSNTVHNIAQLDETFNIIHLSSAVVPSSMNGRIEQATTVSIISQLDELLSQLGDGVMDSELEIFLRANFTFLKWAAANYEAIGTDGLSKAYGMVASEFIRAWGKKDTQANPPQPWWDKARGSLKLIGEGVIWSDKVAGGAGKLLNHAHDFVGLIS